MRYPTPIAPLLPYCNACHARLPKHAADVCRARLHVALGVANREIASIVRRLQKLDTSEAQ